MEGFTFFLMCLLFNLIATRLCLCDERMMLKKGQEKKDKGQGLVGNGSRGRMGGKRL